MKISFTFRSLIIALVLVLVLSCKNNTRIFEKHTDIQNSDWRRMDGNNIVHFEVPVKDTVSEYNILVAVRYITGFPYTNLFIGLTVTTPAGEEKYSQHKLQLRGEDGSYKGEGLGDLWDISIPVIKKYRFNKAGIYKIDVENHMDKYIIPGINQIGLIVEKVKSEK